MRREIRLEAFLANLPLFSGLGADALERLAAGSKRLHLARGEALFHEGERPEGDGVVCVARLNQTPRDAIRKMLRIAESAGAHVAGMVATDAGETRFAVLAFRAVGP